MAYALECKDAEGFTDQLTEGKVYPVMAFKNNSVLINDDNGNAKYFGEMHFRQCEYKD